ncbi:MAG: autotransporter domain-containing protein [Pseudomonadaceae bacterium]|nr:autotransporter domain-containing protein [Pseudomonadaceae bacterium]MBX9761894.1 autotransporter domain-containing protein [Pseudomonadaceae bacterium]
MKRLLSPLAVACCMATVAPSLSAAPYSGLYVFGDSLSDAGQFPDSVNSTTQTRRFTNRIGPLFTDASGEVYGKTSPMLIGELLGLGAQSPSTSSVFESNGWADGNNWAVGGYRTDQILDSITEAGGSVAGTRTRDGFLVDLANRGLSLDANALYYVNGGGNDFLQGQVLSTAQAQAAAGRLVDSVEALQAVGARYIMVSLLPNVGNTPALGGGNSFIGGLAGDLNTELVSQLRGIDANIIPLNLPLLVTEVLATPGAYGFDATQNLTGTCFNGCANVNTTWGINSATPDPSKLLFNDSVHPTTAVQQIAADYAYSLLSAAQELSLLPEMALGNLRAHQGQLRSQWQADWSAWQAIDQWRGFVTAGGQQQDFDSQDNSSSADGDGYSLNLGGSYRLDDAWRVGVALGLYGQDLEAGAANSDYNLNSYLATAFAQYQDNRWWADLALSAGSLDYDNLERSIQLGQVTRTEQGDTDGNLWGASGRVGYDIAQPGSEWHLSPFLSADYVEVDVDGYAEDGSRSTALTFDDQQRDSRRLGAGIQGRYQLSPVTALFAEYSHEREYEDDIREVRSELNSLPGIGFELQGYTPGDSLDSASVGVSHQLTRDLSLRGGYSYSQSDEQSQQGVSVSLALDW